MDDDRLKSSPRELAALRALIEDPAIRVELNTFRARYWPIIKNFGTFPEGLGVWRAEVDSSLLREVEIVNGGVVVAKVPPILAQYPTEAKYHASRAMSKISDDIGHCLDVSPIAADKLIQSVLPTHFSSIETSPQLLETKQHIRDAWDALYVYFGEQPPFNKETAPVTENQKAPDKEVLEIDSYDDL